MNPATQILVNLKNLMPPFMDRAPYPFSGAIVTLFVQEAFPKFESAGVELGPLPRPVKMPSLIRIIAPSLTCCRVSELTADSMSLQSAFTSIRCGIVSSCKNGVGIRVGQ